MVRRSIRDYTVRIFQPPARSRIYWFFVAAGAVLLFSSVYFQSPRLAVMGAGITCIGFAETVAPRDGTIVAGILRTVGWSLVLLGIVLALVIRFG